MTMGETRCVIERGAAGYPAALNDLERAPDQIYVRGAVEALAEPSLAVIGTRDATPYGIAAAELAARVAAAHGLTVVSGGAMGCDQAAGRAALEAGAHHVIVLGTGADVVYPHSASDLIEDTLAAGGAVVSLERWGSPVRRWAFPKRNRIIAALAKAVFIAEAGMPSGTFSTAETATDLGREVLVAPGSLFAPSYRGSNYLISIGATLIADEEGLEIALSRIYGTLRRTIVPARTEPAGSERVQRLMAALMVQAMTLDEAARVLGCNIRSAAEEIGALEVAGFVERQLDGGYAASAHALHAQTSFGHNGGT